MSAKISTADIVVAGVFAADLAFRAERLPMIGETLAGKGFGIGPGGKGSNQAIAAARAGGRVAMLSRIGSDAFGDMARAAWSEAGVIHDAVVTDKDHATGAAFIFVSALTGDNAIIIESGAAAHMSGKDVRDAESLIAGSRVFAVQLEQPLEVAVEGLKLARRHNVITILNPAPATELPAEIYGLCDFITPNETEAEILTGIKTDDDGGAEEAARRLLQMGARNVVMTLGKRGALLCNKDGARIFPAIATEVVDTTGAGDAFNAGLAVALAEGKSIEESIGFAAVTAGISVSRPGTASSMPTRAEIDDRIRALDPARAANRRS